MKTAYIIVHHSWAFNDACSVLRGENETVTAYTDKEKATQEALRLNREQYRRTFFRPYQGCFDALENSFWAYHLPSRRNIKDDFHGFKSDRELNNFLKDLGITTTFKKGKLIEYQFPPTKDGEDYMSDENLNKFLGVSKILFYEVKETTITD